MFNQMMSEVPPQSNLSQEHGPLPDCSFIENNQPIARPAPLTTTTKKGKAAMGKRKAPAKKTDGSAPKKSAAASKARKK